MFVHTVKLLPVRHRRVTTFFATDPLYDDQPTEWNLETYRMLAPGVKIIRADNLLNRGGADLFAIKSELDGAPRMLPEVLTELWRNREVPAEALPELLRTFGPEFSHQRDFAPVLGRRGAGLWMLGLGGALLAALLAISTFFFLFGRNLFQAQPTTAFVQTTMAAWLAEPMRAHAHVNLSATDPKTGFPAVAAVPALAAADLPADFRPTPERFFVPTPTASGVRNPRPGNFTLVRVQARDEQRLVFSSGYARSQLPRVFLGGQVIPTAELALPPAALTQVRAGAQALNENLVLLQEASFRPRGRSPDFFVMLWTLPLILLIFPLGFIVVGLILRPRRGARLRQLRDLRRRLGLPEPTTATAVPR